MDGGGGVSATQRREARKYHRCGCGRRIGPGDIYLSHTIFPGEDAHHYVTKAPVRSTECASCAARYGRDYLIYPLPPAQDHEIYMTLMREGRG